MNLIRPSGLDLVSRCPAAAWECRDLPNVGNDATTLGTMTHEAIVDLLQEREPDAKLLAAKYGLDVEQVKIRINCARLGIKAIPYPDWRRYLEVMVRLPMPRGYPELIGQADLIAESPDDCSLYLLDWKTGFSDYPPPNQNLQVIAYVCMAVRWIEADPRRKIHQVFVQIHYPTTGYMSKLIRFRDDQVRKLDEHIRHVAAEGHDAMKSGSEAYRIGIHCNNCGARLHCPARNAKIAGELSGLEKHENFPQLPQKNKAAIIEKASRCKRFAEDVLGKEGCARNYVSDTGEILPLNGGSKYGIETKEKFRISRSDEAIEVLGLESFLRDDITLNQAVDSLCEKRKAEENRGKMHPGERKEIESALLNSGIVESEQEQSVRIMKDSGKVRTR